MRFVMHQKTREQFVELRGARALAFKRKPALDHDARAVADDIAHLAERYRLVPVFLQDEIERRAEIGRGVDERAVEIESDG